MLSGDYQPLLPYLKLAPVGTLFLELSTPRAGEMDVLKELSDCRIAVGVVNQKRPEVESVAEIEQRMDDAVELFGAERLYFTTDCGFATYADNPVSSAQIAEAKLLALVAAAQRLK
jgi:5-methyltetrahydropteroyltriglutamate--homocysteine methyltransferase